MPCSLDWLCVSQPAYSALPAMPLASVAKLWLSTQIAASGVVQLYEMDENGILGHRVSAKCVLGTHVQEVMETIGSLTTAERGWVNIGECLWTSLHFLHNFFSFSLRKELGPFGWISRHLAVHSFLSLITLYSWCFTFSLDDPQILFT